MKVGNLVRLKNKVNHQLGIYPLGAIGIVIQVKELSRSTPGAFADVRFGRGIITCHRRELEVIGENRQLGKE